MNSHIVRIGNSRGVRLAKPLLEEAGLSGEVEVRVRSGSIVITPVATPRAGWAAAASRLAAAEPHGLLDEPVTSRFDDREWKWQ